MSTNGRNNSAKSASATTSVRRRRLTEAEAEPQVYYNPISRYKEHTEVYGLTLYDIYREPRCIPAPSDASQVKMKDIDANIEEDSKISATDVPISQRNTDNTLANDKSNVETKIKSIQTLNSLFQCPICLGYMKKTFIVMECLHRFCGECIQKCLRVGKKECPSCRVHIPSRRSLRPDLSFDDFIEKVYGVSDVEVLEEEKALEIETLNRERNMNNAYSESRKLGIMQQAIVRQRKVSKSTNQNAFSSITSPSEQLDSNSNASLSQTTTMRRIYRPNSGSNTNDRTPLSQQPTQPMVRVSDLQDHSSHLMNFILRKHPMEKIVERLRKELLRTSKDIRIGQLKRFLGMKLRYEPWSNFQISTPIGGEIVELDNSMKLARVFADVCGDSIDASLVFQYKIKVPS